MGIYQQAKQQSEAGGNGRDQGTCVARRGTEQAEGEY